MRLVELWVSPRQVAPRCTPEQWDHRTVQRGCTGDDPNADDSRGYAKLRMAVRLPVRLSQRQLCVERYSRIVMVPRIWQWRIHGPSTPPGCAVWYLPSSTKSTRGRPTSSVQPKWGGRACRGLFACYVLHSGGSWSGRYLVWPLESWIGVILSAAGNGRSEEARRLFARLMRPRASILAPAELSFRYRPRMRCGMRLSRVSPPTRAGADRSRARQISCQGPLASHPQTTAMRHQSARRRRRRCFQTRGGIQERIIVTRSRGARRPS